MIVFRITTEQWSKTLRASGNVARWNAKGTFIIYTAANRSLACLENLVHRSGEWQGKAYKVMIIEFPDKLKITKIEITDLKKKWEQFDQFTYCQQVADKWLKENKTCVLRVPSVIIKKEYNYLINPQHPDFKLIKLASVEDFNFDDRF